MDSEAIQRAYDELAKMFVEVKPEPERGLAYISERLTLCRAMQDRVAELRLQANRALSVVMEQHLLLQHLHSVAPTPESKEKLNGLERQKQSLAMLAKMVAAQGQVLSRTAMDIRLLTDITKEQLKRGEINPNEAPGLVKEESVGDMVPADAPVRQREKAAVPDNPFPGLGTAVADSKVETVSLDAPVPASLDHEPMKLPETTAVSFDSLFDSLEKTPHGTSAPRIF